MSSDEGTMFCTHDHLEQSPHNLQPSPVVSGPSTNGRGVVRWISATPAPFATPLGNSLHDVCGCVLSKWRPNPINPLDAGWLSPLDRSISIRSSGTSGTNPSPPHVHFRISSLFIRPCVCVQVTRLCHTLYSSVRVFVYRFPNSDEW